MTILVGHFGSGKTEIALSGALALAGQGRHPVLVDLDVVKPYFRSRSGRALMAAHGVEVVAPQGENVHADLPIIVPRIRTLLRGNSEPVIVDAGGDPTGARALGSLADVVAEEGTQTLLVLNFARPFTGDVEAAVAMTREIEASARRRVTGLVSNTHLMSETTVEVVRHGYELARETAGHLGVPLVAVVADEAVSEEVASAGFEAPLFVVRRVVRPPFEMTGERRAIGPLFVLN